MVVDFMVIVFDARVRFWGMCRTSWRSVQRPFIYYSGRDEAILVCRSAVTWLEHCTADRRMASLDYNHSEPRGIA